MSVLGSHLPLKKCFRIQGTCHTPNTVVLTFCVKVSIKSQQAMKTAMTPMSLAKDPDLRLALGKNYAYVASQSVRPPSPGGRGLFFGWWILRLRLRLRAEWQGGRHTAKSESFRTRETNHKGVWSLVYWLLIDAPCIGFGLILWLLVIDWCLVHWLWIDAVCIGFWLMLCRLVFDWFMCLALNKSGSYRAVCSCIL